MQSMTQGRASRRREYGKTEQQQQPQQQEDGLTCDEYYMALAFLSAQRSKDPSTQVGACIVKDDQILSTGYNGMPTGCHDDLMPWGREGNDLNKKYFYVCHAEMNAILNKNDADVRGAQVHVTLFPCANCAKLIIQSGIASVVYYSDKDADKEFTRAAKLMFRSNGVEYKNYCRESKDLTLNLDKNYESLDSNSSTRIDSPSTTSQSLHSTGPKLPRPYPAYINWVEYFMAVALLAARCSKGSKKQAGACLVNSDHRIVGIGFDTLISMETLPEEQSFSETYNCMHAEAKAILNKNCSDVHECSLYVTRFPCNECAKVIVQAGITNVIYSSVNKDDETTASKMIFDLAHVKYVKYSSSRSLNTKIALNF